MDLASKPTIKKLLGKQGIRPQKRLGQNFLIDEGAVQKIIEATDLQPSDLVLEIGPGIGVLTQELAKRVKKVVAVEKDPKMIEILGETLKDFKNVEIVHGDIRKSDFPKTPGVDGKTPGVEARKSDFQNFKVVGNLPFYLTAPVIRQFLEHTENGSLYATPKLMVLVVQKEVGQRICARPPRMSLLAVSVQFYAEPKIISYISNKSFWPSPEVDAAILKIIPKPKRHRERVSVRFSVRFFEIVRSGFSQPRKQLINNLSKGLKIDRKKIESWLKNNGIQPIQRAETLTLEDWVKLTKTSE